MASTSAREIGSAAAAPAGAPGDADAPVDAGEPEVVPADGAPLAACLEPKMADTMLPNTLMMSSWPRCRSLPLARGGFPLRSRQVGSAVDRRHILEPDDETMQSTAFCFVVTATR